MRNELEHHIEAARRTLHLAVGLSKQGSYARRAPEPVSLPHFAEARTILSVVLKQDPDNREALMMMSRLSESLLDFDAAVAFLNRALDVGEPRTKKIAKRLALLHQSAQIWRQLILSPSELRDLGNYLEAKGVGPAHRTMQLTREWLQLRSVPRPDEVIAALEGQGAFSDFQVLSNVVHG